MGVKIHSPLTVVSLLLLSLVHQGHGSFTKDPECGVSKGCYSDCNSNGECNFQVTWIDKDTVVTFTLKGEVFGGNYIALGLSKDNKMGDDSVTSCSFNGNFVKVYQHYNVMNNKYNEKLTDALKGLSAFSGSKSNDVLECQFNRIKNVVDTKIFNLNNDYFVFLARGAASGDGALGKHAVIPLISPNKINFQSKDIAAGTNKNVFIKVHASLMVFAWVFSASLGIVLARFYKPVWPNTRILGDKVWFVCHRGIMVTAVMAVITGFVLIFVEIEGWSMLTGNPNYQRAHPYLGVVVMAIALLNPIMALCRPHPEEKNRKIFNWAHWAVGTGGHAIAIVNIFIGVTLPASNTPQYLLYILAAYAIYQFLMEMFLECYDCGYKTKEKDFNEKISHYEMRASQYGAPSLNGSQQQFDPRSSFTGSNGNFAQTFGDPPQKFGAPTEPEFSTESFWFKKLLLGIHILVLLGFTIAIIFIIGLA